MSKEDAVKVSVEEYSRLQDWMRETEDDSMLYNVMMRRRVDLKGILSGLGIDSASLDVMGA